MTKEVILYSRLNRQACTLLFFLSCAVFGLLPAASIAVLIPLTEGPSQQRGDDILITVVVAFVPSLAMAITQFFVLFTLLRWLRRLQGAFCALIGMVWLLLLVWRLTIYFKDQGFFLGNITPKFASGFLFLFMGAAIAICNGTFLWWSRSGVEATEY